MIIFLFGRPWSGKTQVGQKLAKILGTTFRDGDDWYTEEEKDKITRNEFNWDDSRKFFSRLNEELKMQQCGGRMLVISGQGIFLRQYRQELKDTFGDNIFLVYLRVPKEITIVRAMQPRTYGGKEHFYGSAQYVKEVDEFEEEGVYDFRVENLGSSEQAAQNIVRGITKHYRKIGR